MARSLTTAQENALQSDEVYLAFAYEAKYSNDTVRAWTGVEELKFDSDGDNSDETFLPVGEFASIPKINETTDIRAEGFQVELNGVPIGEDPDALEDALREDYHGKDAKLWIVILDSAFNIVDSPVLINSGFQDTHQVTDNGQSLTVTVNIENPMRNLRRKATRHYTKEDQKIEDSDDRFFDHVEQIQDKDVLWGPDV